MSNLNDTDRKAIFNDIDRVTNDLARRLDAISNRITKDGKPSDVTKELNDISGRLRALGHDDSNVDGDRSVTNRAMLPPEQRNTQAPLVGPNVREPDISHGTRFDHQNGVTTYSDGTRGPDAAVGNGKPGPAPDNMVGNK
jgi:hypothetical protein